MRLERSTATKVTLDSLARLTALAEPVCIVAAGGTGKSTTLLQLAEHLLAADEWVPVLVPLGDWSDRTDDFFDFILRRNAFGAFRRQHLMQLAYRRRLVLLLDGWNELTPEARLRATRDLKALQRDYPELGFAITTGGRLCLCRVQSSRSKRSPKISRWSLRGQFAARTASSSSIELGEPLVFVSLSGSRSI